MPGCRLVIERLAQSKTGNLYQKSGHLQAPQVAIPESLLRAEVQSTLGVRVRSGWS